ncbi:MAG TPA: choice-of-anchor Q domain-containing protein [Candidatus Hydrogenedentes bacterium]|nr:choice-of-anchor Q domain-containing protein [Candidatus Hydrogenedentota bacterium]
MECNKTCFMNPRAGYVRHCIGFVLVAILFAFFACSEEMFKGESEDAGDVFAEGESPHGIWYVDVDNTSGVYDGLTWETAFVAVQQGSVAAVDTGGEVWVAEGIYCPPVTMFPGVHLYGGFAGNETARDQRDWNAHPTVISGGMPGVTSADNATLDGFQITAGIPGMTIDSGMPVIRNCVFSDNVAVGEPAGPPSMGSYGNGAPGGSATNWALVISGGAPVLENCIFSDNGAVGAPGGNGIGSGWCVAFSGGTGGSAGGGGVQITSSGAGTFINCVFHDNFAYPGAGGGRTCSMYCGCGVPGGTGTLLDAGAIWFAGAALSVVNCTFADNIGGIVNASESPADIVNSIVWTPGISTLSTGVAAIVYSDVIDGYTGEGNINADPLFVNPDDGDLRLSEGSPCINLASEAAAPGADLLGVVRPQGAGPDMGAYEFLSGSEGEVEGESEGEVEGEPEGEVEGEAEGEVEGEGEGEFPLFAPPEVLNTNAATDSGDDYRARLDTDGSGRFIAVWRSNDTLGGTTTAINHIFKARSEDYGETWSAPSLLCAMPDDMYCSNPFIASDRAGNWMVLWSTTLGSDHNLCMSRSGDNGITWTDPSIVDDGDTGSIYTYYSIATDRAGRWAAVWITSATALHDYYLRSSVSSDDGATWSPPVVLDSNASTHDGSLNWPGIVMDTAGNGVIIWQKTTSDTNGVFSLNRVVSDDSGATWSAADEIDTQAPYGIYQYHLATDHAGLWVMVWQRSNEAIGYLADLEFVTSGDKGTTWSAPLSVHTHLSGDTLSDMYPHVISAGSGRWLIAWQGQRGSGDADIYYSLSGDNAAAWTTTEALNTNAGSDVGNDLYPAGACDALGNVVVAWTSMDSLGGTIGTDADILFARSIPVPVEGEGETPVEGEGEPPVEGEGETPVEGEGEAPVEGEGEIPVEGEGEPPTEGEGELVPITTLFNTGVDNSGMILADNTTDPHYRLKLSADPTWVGPATYASGDVPAAWNLIGTDSRWIAARYPSTAVEAGYYHYQTTFDLTGMQPATAIISGRFSADNYLSSVQLNGTVVPQVTGGFNTWYDFALPQGSAFVEGVNTLVFIVRNLPDDIGANYSGLRVEMAGWAMPEIPVEGEGEVLPEGEGELLPEGEGEIPVEGEGEPLVEGEAEADVWYVNQSNSSGIEDGTSWATAYRDVQTAVDAAMIVGGEVWVAAGTYTGSGPAVLTMRSGVYLYGGFAGVEEAREERNWTVNPTTLSGQFARRCVVGADNAVLDGFVISDGRHVGGGGLYNDHASPAIANCWFVSNDARGGDGADGCYIGGFGGHGYGGAIYNIYASPTIINCVFWNNHAVGGQGGDAVCCDQPAMSGNGGNGMGGAIYNDTGASPSIINCTFYNNEAQAGSPGAHVPHCYPRLYPYAFGYPGAAGGGAIFGNASVVNCILWNNTPNEYSGGYDVVPDITYSDVKFGAPGAGNISADPLFVDGAAGNLQLSAESPCVDAGSGVNFPELDMLGVSRPQCLGVDMGAYEYAGPCTVEGEGEVIAEGEDEGESVHPADLNADWRMVISEAIAYLAGWQQGTNPLSYAIRAAYLWQNGENYRYDAGQEPPLCWVP